LSTTTLAPGEAAAALAQRINVPVRLPNNYKGEPIRHLSHSALSRFLLCPEDYRRSYLLGEWGPPSGAMFVGNRVDETVTAFYEHQLAGELLNLDQLEDLFAENWKAKLAEEIERDGSVEWEDCLDAEQAHAIGLQAVKVTYDELVPRLGRPLAAQRKFEFKIHPEPEWSVFGYVDLDTVREQRVFVTENGEQYAVQDEGESEPTVELGYLEAPADRRGPVKRGRKTLAPAEAIDTYRREWDAYQASLTAWAQTDNPQLSEPKEPAPLPVVAIPVSQLAADAVEREVVGITDYKVKNSLISASKADSDPQASLYLTERWMAGNSAFDFRFAQVGKPKQGKRNTMSTALVATKRSEAQMRATLARVAMAASQIVALYQQLGPDRPWGYATQEWKCGFCNHAASCPLSDGGLG
jgi:hypothetical protein